MVQPTRAIVYAGDRESADSSDEERMWLDALESGSLDDNGELKRDRDDSLLTARQRALLHGQREEVLHELPTGWLF